MIHQQKAQPRLRDELMNLPDPELLNWAKSIDESDYSLEEWVTALIEFHLWEEKNKPLSITTKLDYLICCTEGSVQTGKLLPLSELLIQYLNAHGVESNF